MRRVSGWIMLVCGNVMILLAALAVPILVVLVFVRPVVPPVWAGGLGCGALVLPLVLRPPGFILRSTGALLARQETPGSTCPHCRYDLRGGTSGGCCPECGWKL